MLDGLRGFALLGIFLANLGYFSGWILLGPEQRELATSGLGVVSRDFIHLAFIDGKFYTIFSLLFGIGFAVQLERLSTRGADFGVLYLRRLTGLLAIGLVHLCLIWDGGILTLYALCGFVLFAVRDWSTRLLFRVGIALIVLPVPGYALVWLAGWSSPGPIPQDWGYALWQYRVGRPVTDADALAMMRRDGLDGYFDWVLSGPLFRWATLLDNWRIPKVLGTFLLGVCAGREITAGRLLGDRKRVGHICAWGFVVGLPANLALARYAGQLLFSRLWLARFRFGPAEWLWRCWTYGRWHSLRARQSAVGG